MDHSPLDVAPPKKSRRHMLQSAVALAATGMVADHQVSQAIRGWCRSDPIILIEGVIVDIFCTAPLSALLHVTGPTEIVVSVPVGVAPTLVLAGIGFGRGELVSFAATDHLTYTAGTLALEVAVYVPARKQLPIGVELARNLIGILNPTRAEGVTNQWITLTTEFPAGSLLGLLPSLDEQLGLAAESAARNQQRARDKRAHSRRKKKKGKRR